MFDFVSVKLSLCIIISILIGFYFEPHLKTCGLVLLGSLVTLLIAYIKSIRDGFPYFGPISYFTTICLGFFIVALSNPKNSSSHYSTLTLSKPAVWKVKIREVLKPNSYSNNYIVEAKTSDSISVSGKLLLNIQKDSNKIRAHYVDQELLLISEALAIKPPLNPYGFDYKDYLKKQGVYHRLQIGVDSYSKTKNSSKTLIGIAANFREQLIRKLKEAPFGADELGVIQALLLGQRNDISARTYDSYKDAGAVHILAVSGLHIGILLLLLQFLLKPLELLPKGKTIKLIAIVLLLWSFAFIAGLSPSIFRSVMMFSFIAYAMYLNRPSNTFNILALSMFVILLIKPMVLFQVGFQMSYAAVFAIAWIYPMLQRFWYPKNWILRKGWQLLSVSCAAQMGVLPISLFYFHQFPTLFFISNLVIIPFLGIILGIGILVLTLAWFDRLPDIVANAYNFLIGKMNSVIAWVARQENFVLRDISFDQFQLVLTYGLILLFILSLSKPTFRKVSMFLIGVLFFQVWLTYNQWQLDKTEYFILGHQTANTFFLHQKGDHLNIIGSENSHLERITANYKVARRIDSVNKTSLENSYTIGKNQLYVIDSSGIIPYLKGLDYLLLTQSPKINLERLIDSVRPKQVLVDGSNYKSFVNRWKETCLKKEIPFHYTGEKGAFYFAIE
ncbi:ComEC/Rec2 family competence protein [Croceitalea rosinachiae]|uniref:ComEC/Rec2 family competence protein n=1 Tax=Croceitalea rosinachiae TaxID=3075596 RepID=A0ABU3AA39_9FLAO|nr:ComEC/Rec2 family competence protein [Croceitalea sp. F388]MDT0606753.1 ComEC/Rec2 family competence protein [Croceitalea sp. F388]